MVVLRYYYQGKSYPKREFELIDRYWARLKLKMFKNQEKIWQELRIDELKNFVDSSKFSKVTLTNQLFSVELSKNDDRQGKRSEIRT